MPAGARSWFQPATRWYHPTLRKTAWMSLFLNVALMFGMIMCSRERCGNNAQINTGSGASLDVDQSCDTEYHFAIVEIRDQAKKILAGSLSGTIIFFVAAIALFIYFVHIPKHKLATRPCGFCLSPRNPTQVISPQANLGVNQLSPIRNQMYQTRVVQQQPAAQMASMGAVPPIELYSVVQQQAAIAPQQQEEIVAPRMFVPVTREN
jgi:hypothetical protein